MCLLLDSTILVSCNKTVSKRQSFIRTGFGFANEKSDESETGWISVFQMEYVIGYWILLPVVILVLISLRYSISSGYELKRTSSNPCPIQSYVNFRQHPP